MMHNPYAQVKKEQCLRYVQARLNASHKERVKLRNIHNKAIQTEDIPTTSFQNIFTEYTNFKKDKEKQCELFAFVLHSPQSSPPRKPAPIEVPEPDLLSPCSRIHSTLRQTLVEDKYERHSEASTAGARSVVTIEEVFADRPDMLRSLTSQERRDVQGVLDRADAEVINLDED
eukprot:PhF_6_TR41148/c0_g1_i1/m.62312